MPGRKTGRIQKRGENQVRYGPILTLLKDFAMASMVGIAVQTFAEDNGFHSADMAGVAAFAYCLLSLDLDFLG